MISRQKSSLLWAVGLLGFLFLRAPCHAQNLPGAFSAESNQTPSNTWVNQPLDFDRSSLLQPSSPSTGLGFQFLNPNRFSMHQSYSLNFTSGNGGNYSSGLYLNTLSYQLADPLTLSLDVGFHTPFYSSGSMMQGGVPWNGGDRPSLVLPRIGLEYKPTEHTSISLQLINGNDAMKAYGSPLDGGHSSFWPGF